MPEATEQQITGPKTHTFYTRSGVAIQARQSTAGQVGEWVECKKRMVNFKAFEGDWVISVGLRTYVMQDKIFKEQYVEQRP